MMDIKNQLQEALELCNQLCGWKADKVGEKIECVIKELESAPVIPDVWIPIAQAPENFECIVRWVDKEDGLERLEFDVKEDGCWMGWENHVEWADCVAKPEGNHIMPSRTPPYTEFFTLPARSKEPSNG